MDPRLGMRHAAHTPGHRCYVKGEEVEGAQDQMYRELLGTSALSPFSSECHPLIDLVPQ